MWGGGGTSRGILLIANSQFYEVYRFVWPRDFSTMESQISIFRLGPCDGNDTFDWRARGGKKERFQAAICVADERHARLSSLEVYFCPVVWALGPERKKLVDVLKIFTVNGWRFGQLEIFTRPVRRSEAENNSTSAFYALLTRLLRWSDRTRCVGRFWRISSCGPTRWARSAVRERR